MAGKHPSERITQVLGSWFSIGFFTLWFCYRNVRTDGFNPLHWDFLNVISELAIVIGLIILQGQNVQSERMEYDIKRTKRDTKKDLAKSDKVIRMLKRNGNRQTAKRGGAQTRT